MRFLQRRGWEDAYIDYESLKLLLTQIEAVYEDSSAYSLNTGSRRLVNNDIFYDDDYSDASSSFYDDEAEGDTLIFGSHGKTNLHQQNKHAMKSNKKGERQTSKRKKLGRRMDISTTSSSHFQHNNFMTNNLDRSCADFRKELFLESDSSFAYMSVSDEESSYDEEIHNNNNNSHLHDPESKDYNDDYMCQYDDEDSDDDIMSNIEIGRNNFDQGDRRLQHQNIQYNQPRHFISPNHMAQTHNDNTVLSNFKFSYSGQSYGTGSGEATSNSMPYGSSTGVRSFISDDHHPPYEHYHADDDDQVEDERMPMISKPHRRASYGFGTTYSTRSNDSFVKILPKEKTDKHVHQKIKRSSKYGYIMKKRKRKPRHSHTVPTHIRVSHAKAKAITGRFLGLLRAEVDKICLFAHSRFGELTETCGSLRFPFDQQMEFRRTQNDLIGSHPSASSSSDEGHTSSHEDSRDDKPRNNSNLKKPPLFPRARSDKAKTREEILSDEDETYMKLPAYRQLKIAEELRIAKPTFHRSDYVLGEDFLLLSAVDEADAYTTVGVEFLHLLKFICVNAIAVRRLCRKHDRLLASRMLGGYYHRMDEAQKAIDASYRFRSLSENCKHTFFHQNVIFSSSNPSQHKLTGVFDSIIMGLANNAVAEDISQSLYLALAEYEVSRHRADFLSGRHNSKIALDNVEDVDEKASCFHFPSPRFALSPNAVESQKDRGKSDDASSTASSISLTRLRFAVTSVIRLREAAFEDHQPFKEYMSRSMIATDGSKVVGMRDGLHGCSKDALSDIVQYNPDIALLHNTQILKDYLSSGDDGFKFSNQSANDVVTNIEDMSQNGLNIDMNENDNNKFLLSSLNLSSMALTTMNYYMIVPSAASFCHEIQSTYSHSIFLICAPSVSNLVSSLFQLGKDGIKTQEINIYNNFALSAVCHLLGNIIYTIAHDRNSIWLAVASRFIVGIFSSDVPNKQLVMRNVRKGNTVHRMARLRKIQLLSIAAALFLGSLMEIEPITFSLHQHLFTFSFETLPAYVMFLLWTVQMVGIILLPPPPTSPISHATSKETMITSSEQIDSASDQDSQTSQKRRRRRHSRSPSDQSKLDYYMKRLERNISEMSNQTNGSKKVTLDGGLSVEKTWKDVLHETIKLILNNVAMPISMLLHTISILTIEIITVSLPLITHRYFDWSGSKAGYFLAILAAFYIPIHYVVSVVSNIHEERTIVKKGCVSMIVGLIIGINYQSFYESVIYMYNDILSPPNHYHEAMNEFNEGIAKYYDWKIGFYQYCLGTVITFTSAVSIGSASLSLISKTSSEKLNSASVNCNTLIPLLHACGRVIGGSLLSIFVFSHHHIYTDIVNSISLFLIAAYWLCYHQIKKYYFFLYGDAL